MQEKDIIKVLDEINNYLSTQLWMDFEFIEYSCTTLRIMGSLDISASPVMELILSDVFFVSAPFNWKTDTSRTVISLVSGDEARIINVKYRVEMGYYIIKMKPEDYPEEFGCLFAAKKIRFNLL